MTYKDSRIGYYRFGSGRQLVFCLHGYGELASAWGFLEAAAGVDFTFIALELPLHGNTEWKQRQPMAPADLLVIMEQLAGTGKPVWLMGFSLGGRLGLAVYELQPTMFERLILLAPDGLKVNTWYWLTTQTWLGNRLFKFTMDHPSWFFILLKFGHSIRLVNASIYKFVRRYIGDADARRLLYLRWTALRRFRPNLTQVRKSIRQFDTRVQLMYGQHDRIIVPGPGHRFVKDIEDRCSLVVIESGHQVLQSKHSPEIVALLLN